MPRFRGHDSEASRRHARVRRRFKTYRPELSRRGNGEERRSGVGIIVWDPRDLQIAAKFAANGPLLPIEFCRVSADGRLTLAIDETFGALCKTYSAPSALEDLDAAMDNLRQQRGNDGRAARSASSSPLPAGKATSRWNAIRRSSRRSAPGRRRSATTPRSGRALTSNFDDWGKGGEPFSVSAALQYLETLERDDPAKFARGARLHSQRAARGRDAGARARRQALALSDGTAQPRFSPVAKPYPSGTPTFRIIS